ncbi:hypothetical protein DPMN_099105 [Dreissena polymorpha]|uniref:ADP-ribosylhydrolase ARH1 n=1 Tax=Dreissena polymorpha TaxID=45954 RepID=A0A9D4R7W4_DREPO|nr:hypothetical protein DPMN_099105 [Dreissena polymorpha]
MKDMAGRSPGQTCMNSCRMLKPNLPGGYRIPFDPRGGGCGAAMRAMWIGLRYPNLDNIDDLIKVSVEAGRMIHNHPTGYLGSFSVSLFTSYSVQGKPIREWGKGMMDLLPQVQDYVNRVNVYVEENLQAYDSRWEDLCSRSLFHCGDSDSTGVIAAAFYGAMFGFQGVPKNNYDGPEKKQQLLKLAEKLFEIMHRKY